jgi:acetyltransferase
MLAVNLASMSTPRSSGKVSPTSEGSKEQMPTHDRAHDVLRSEPHSLDAIFVPRSVAVIGATDRPGSVGRAVLWSLVSSPFGGTVYPVSDKRSSVMGIKAYRTVADLPETVDLAVVVTPASTVPRILGDCVEAGVRGAIVISAGFKEHGAAGQELERQILERIQGSRLRVIGPNCLGVMNPVTGLNATFASTIARPGNVGFISQSGALCTAILDWAQKEMVGFSAFVSVGSMLDVNWGDLIDYLGNDPRTQSIMVYMESVGDARSFLSAAREVSLTKPIIVIKAGRTDAAAKAASSHTGSLTGSDEVLEAGFRRCGVLRVQTIADLFYMAEVLAKQPRPKGPRLAIVTNAGGPGVLAADGLLSHGGQLAQLSGESIQALNALLPPHWSHNNPIDVLGDALPERYAKAVEIAAQDPNIDGLLAIVCPQGMAGPTATAESLKPYAHSTGKPVLASWMGGPGVAAGTDILNQAGIPTFQFPDTAARVFCYMWRYSYALRGLYETPVLRNENDEGPNRGQAQRIIETALHAGRTLLTEVESKQLLAAYGLPVVPTEVAVSEDDAAAKATAIGYPIVIKLFSETITHKTDVGGVHLDLRDEQSVRSAYRSIEASVKGRGKNGDFLGVTVQPMVKVDGYELIVGSSVDAQFGPVLLFGTGGQLVEVFKDRALALPPLNTTLARRMMEQTRVFPALAGVRGRKSVDLAGLEEFMVRFSQMVVEQPRIREIDINPVLASPERIVALDARVVLHGAEIADDRLPRPAIRPYPVQYVKPWIMKNGETVTIRPIRPEDEPLLIRLHQVLSERTVYLRYFQPLKLSQRTAHERLTRICFIDYDREMVFAVERKVGAQTEIIAIGRLSKLRERDNEGELAVLVDDRYQGQGLGTELYRRLIAAARDEKLRRVVSTILAENREMRAICKKLGFRMAADLEDGTVSAELEL